MNSYMMLRIYMTPRMQQPMNYPDMMGQIDQYIGDSPGRDDKDVLLIGRYQYYPYPTPF